MKRFVFYMVFLLAGTVCFPLPGQENDSLLVVIDGEVSSSNEMEVAGEYMEEIHYLSPPDAARAYGPAGARGAFIVKTRKILNTDPLIILDGEKIHADSLQNIAFEKIEVLRGKQALAVYGPTAGEEVWLVHKAEGSIFKQVQVEVRNKEGRPLSGVELRNEEGKLLARTNSCGIASFENFSSGDYVLLSAEKYPIIKYKIRSSKASIVLEK